MEVTFWGTRGSLATPGRATMRYGGNTACVEVRAADGTLIVLDCGTGARALGQALLASGEKPLRGHLLITHTHWDHIQGFPFFAPLFVPGNEWDVYAPGGPGQSLADVLTGQMQYAYFPLSLHDLGAAIRFHDLREEDLQIGEVRITSFYLNHPGLTLGYRIECAGAVVVYATDHEPHSPHQPGPHRSAPVHAEDGRHLDFLRGADLLIHDAQYTAAEAPAKVGWGHTTAEHATDMAIAAGARRLALFHHDPSRDDEALDALLALCRGRAAEVGSALEIVAAAEGESLSVAAAATGRAAPPIRPSVADARRRADEPLTILIVDDEESVARLLARALAPDGYRFVTATSGAQALDEVRRVLPDLVLLDRRLPDSDGLDVCRAIRADADPTVRGAPVVLLTAVTGADETAAGFAAGATDYLTKPFGVAHVRTRVRQWLTRVAAESVPG